MLFAIVICLFLTAILFDGLTLLKGADKKEKIIYFSILLISFGILVPFSLNVNMPDISGVIKGALDALIPGLPAS